MKAKDNQTISLSFITAVWETKPNFLRECCDSIYSQRSDFLGNIEHVIVDDASKSESTKKQLRKLSQNHFYKVDRLEEHGGIIGASRKALELAAGEYIGFIDHDDVLTPGALKIISDYIQAHPEADIFYSDEAQLNPNGQLVNHFYKPSWSPERMRSQNYCSNLTIIRKSLIEEVGGIRDGFEGSQDYALFLRASEKANAIVHIPEVLYLWRVVPESVSSGDADVKPYAYESAKKALEEHGKRCNFKNVEVIQTFPQGIYQLKRSYPEKVKISVIVPTAFKEKSFYGVTEIMALHALNSLAKYDSPDYELEIIVTTNKEVSDSIRHQFLDKFPNIIFHINPAPFNFSRQVNEAAAIASGDFFFLLNDDTELINEDSLERMLSYFSESDVGIVGAKLLYPDGRIQHAGVLHYKGGPFHLLRGSLGTDDHYSGSLFCSREVSAVTFAAALIKREVYDQVGGLCEDLVNNFNDVDCCVKVRHVGYRIIYAADAVFYHFESETRGNEVTSYEVHLMQKRWLNELKNDPYVNPNLDFSQDRLSILEKR